MLKFESNVASNLFLLMKSANFQSCCNLIISLIEISTIHFIFCNFPSQFPSIPRSSSIPIFNKFAIWVMLWSPILIHFSIFDTYISSNIFWSLQSCNLHDFGDVIQSLDWHFINWHECFNHFPRLGNFNQVVNNVVAAPSASTSGRGARVNNREAAASTVPGD